VKRREAKTVGKALRQLKGWQDRLDRFYALREIVHTLGLLAAATDSMRTSSVPCRATIAHMTWRAARELRYSSGTRLLKTNASPFMNAPRVGY
jgi:hypothetical protein